MLFDYFSATSEPDRAAELERRMANYYATNHAYYEDIHFATSAWMDPNEHIHQDLLRHSQSGVMVEIGCGRAQALKSGRIDARQYHGCDYSTALLELNQRDFPTASFTPLTPGTGLPFDSATFDFVFSVFVLEHVVRPDRLLSEMARICKPGGLIAILCPDYFGRLSMVSQIIGWGSDSGMHKLRRGHILDAIWSSFVARFLLPLYLKRRLKPASARPVFLMNANPSCFVRPFFPDADAVYVTHRGEIARQLASDHCIPCDEIASQQAKETASKRRLLYALFRKQPPSMTGGAIQ